MSTICSSLICGKSSKYVMISSWICSLASITSLASFIFIMLKLYGSSQYESINYSKFIQSSICPWKIQITSIKSTNLSILEFNIIGCVTSFPITNTLSIRSTNCNNSSSPTFKRLSPFAIPISFNILIHNCVQSWKELTIEMSPIV